MCCRARSGSLSSFYRLRFARTSTAFAVLLRYRCSHRIHRVRFRFAPVCYSCACTHISSLRSASGSWFLYENRTFLCVGTLFTPHLHRTSLLFFATNNKGLFLVYRVSRYTTHRSSNTCLCTGISCVSPLSRYCDSDIARTAARIFLHIFWDFVTSVCCNLTCLFGRAGPRRYPFLRLLTPRTPLPAPTRTALTHYRTHTFFWTPLCLACAAHSA